MSCDSYSDKEAEAVAKQLEPVYCVRCGSRLELRTLKHNGFDKNTGYPKYDITLGCPHLDLYATDVLGEVSFTWKSPFDRHTVHRVSKVIELNSGSADARYKRGDAYDEKVKLVKYCPNCGRAGVQDMKFCPQCGQRLTRLGRDEKQAPARKPEAVTKERNWFERHLNWAMVLAWLSAYPIAFIVGLLVMLGDSYISEEELGGMSVIVGLIISVAVGRWVLKKKNRSMWYLLLSPTVFFLFIENQSLMRDEHGRTVADYDKLIELDPDNADAYHERGDFYYGMDEYGKAMADYSRAIELDPGYASAYFNRAYAYGETDEYDKAIADYSKVIELDSTDTHAYYNRALDYLNKGQAAKAISDLEKCIELSAGSELAKDAEQALSEVKKPP